MIDAGNSPAHLNQFLEACLKLGLDKPDFILLTHWHWDHVFGLAESRIPSICTNLTQLKLSEMGTWKWDDESMQQRLDWGEDIEFCDINMRVEYQDCTKIKARTADITFKDELQMDCGEITVVMKHLDNDHAIDSCVIYVPEEKILFLGDIISPDYHHGEPHYTQPKFTALWENLMSYDFEIAIHGHTEFFNKQTLNVFFEEAKGMIKSFT
jgi:glyoxylase-like metal-dependent hydrolase (beta-lactamase superfamily II)